MISRSGVLLVTKEPQTETAVACALESNDHFAPEGVCRNLSQLVASLERTTAPGALVDIAPNPTRMLADLDAIITRFVDTRFIVLSQAYQDALVLEAMQIGARHFLLKKSIGSDLVGVLERLILNGSNKRAAKGAAITVLSACGGCGATTVAVNLANELQLTNSQATLLIDLDCCYGAVASFLGLNGQYGLADVLADRGRMDPQLIRSTALVCCEGLHVLLSPASTNLAEPKPLAYQHLGQALELCKRTYGHTVIDAPRVPLDVAATLAAASQATLIVFQLSVRDIRMAQAMISNLTGRGVSADRIVPLVNRYRRRGGMVALEEAQKALGRAPLARIDNDFRSAMRAINYGQPLAEAAPRSSLRRNLRELAVQLSRAPLDGALVSAGC